MPRFSEHYRLNASQAELDFVDISTDYDTPVYVDPYAIEIQEDAWSDAASHLIRSFFLEVLEALRRDDDLRAQNLMSHLTEPSETFLGVSLAKPKGRGVGRKQAGQMIQAIKRSKAFETGLLHDISEMSLYVEGVDRDKISDLTTNIIRSQLVAYTNEQCAMFGIPVTSYNGPALWDVDRLNWVGKKVDLPHIDGHAVLLVPKYIVRRRLSLDSQEFYNKQITDHLVSEHLTASSSLVQVLKSGPKVYKKDVREEHPRSKKFIAEMVAEHPELLDLYKQTASLTGAMAVIAEDDPSISAVCQDFARRLGEIPPGHNDADAYHSLVLGILTALFYPSLVQPRKEWDINDGRKRIDIVYTNSADDGFLAHRRVAQNTSATMVIVECKNYSNDIANVEIDQMLGRFDHNRGRFGIVTCRKIDKKKLLLNRCRDLAKPGAGYIICLEDDDLLKMLEHKAVLDDTAIERILQDKFRQLIA